MKNTVKIALFVIVLASIIGMIFYGINIAKEVAYQDNYDKAFKLIQEVCFESESSSQKMLKVWYNNIYKVNDEETNEYTKNENDIFYSDFNDTLSKYFASKEFNEHYKTASKALNEVSLLMKELNKPTNKFEKAFDALLNYFSYCNDFYNLAFNTQGSLDSCTEKYNQLENEYNDIFQKAIAYSSYYIEK